MSVACFPCSLPAGPFGYPDGRRTAQPPAETSRLISLKKYRGPVAVAPTNSSPSPSPQIPSDHIVFNLKDWLAVHQSVKRVKGTSFPDDPDYIVANHLREIVPTTDGSLTHVTSNDIVILPDIGVSARLYLPEAAESPEKKVPILVYFHGGGFIIESIGSPHYHHFLARLAANATVLIVSVNYRLAPEYPIPAPYDDSMAALNWVVSQSKPGTGLLGSWLTEHGDFSQLFVSGDSAGANTTHYVTMQADAGVNIQGVALLHPYFFGKRPVEKEEDDTENMFFHSKLWPFIAPESEGLDDPRLNPLGPKSPSLKGIKCKRAIVVVADEDFLRFRGKLYYGALAKAMGKGRAGLVEQPGVGHDYFLDDYKIKQFVELMTQMIAFLKGEQVHLERSGPVTFTTN